jgi:branched-chain amino acid transport system ATP-binding protein
MTTQPTDDVVVATSAERRGGDAPTMLDVAELCVTYPRTGIAVDSLSFTVGEREAVAILGPNGAGKTTTVRAITGFLSSERVHQRARHVTFQGRSIFRRSPHTIARAGVSVIPERDKVFRQLRVSENLELARAGRPRRETEDVLDLIHQLFPILAERRSQAAGLLSGGQNQKLAIAAAVLQRPSLLVADQI